VLHGAGVEEVSRHSSTFSIFSTRPLSLAESMMILLQQHNMKEEQMLYAMCDRVLAPDEKSGLVEKMEKVEL